MKVCRCYHFLFPRHLLLSTLITFAVNIVLLQLPCVDVLALRGGLNLAVNLDISYYGLTQFLPVACGEEVYLAHIKLLIDIYIYICMLTPNPPALVLFNWMSETCKEGQARREPTHNHSNHSKQQSNHESLKPKGQL